MKSILIWGFAKSGRASFNLMYNTRDNFFLYDENTLVQESLFNEFKFRANVFILKKLSKDIVLQMSQIILSPAVSIYNEFIKLAQRKKIEVAGELELASRYTKNKIVAITGTNGKTTTVSLVAEILCRAGKRAEAVGNIGTPLSSRVKIAKRGTIFVTEVSSFQLETASTFRPHIACLLNVTPDHLDRHGTLPNYKKTKCKIFANQKPRDFAVINSNLKVTTRARKLTFNGENGNTFARNGEVIFRYKAREEVVCKVEDIHLLGAHNLENVLCAVTVCKLLKVKNRYIIDTLKTFALHPHRLQKVFEFEGKSFYDDSKATNVDATIKATLALKTSGDTYLLLGGSDKGYDYAPIFKNLPKNIVGVVASGGVREKIERAYKESDCQVDFKSFATLREGVNFCLDKMQAGENLLLSPASASFDEFENYKERGRAFLEYVKTYYNQN